MSGAGAKVSAGVVAGIIILCFLGPCGLSGLGVDGYRPDATAILEPPSVRHWLGTDALGRDVLFRLLVGGRVSLAVAFAATAASVGFGAAVGLWAGYVGGWVDSCLMRFTEAAIALPKLPVMMVVAAIDPTRRFSQIEPAMVGLVELSLLIAAFGWMGAARVARASTARVKARDFVRAAEAFGARRWSIVRRHILPHVTGPLAVVATLEFGEFVVYESVLSFLGLGVVPPTPSWGAMLSGAFAVLSQSPLIAIAPGLATFVTVAAFNRLGDALSDRIT